MTITAFFTQRLDILRASASSPASVDEWNQPAYTADAVLTTVDGEIQPLTLREVAQLSDAGAEIGDYRAFLDITDVTAKDRIRESGVIYEVRSVLTIGGRFGHHLELLLRRVTD